MSAQKKQGNQLPHISNSKARHKFTLGDKYEAGIELKGTEVKSIRSGNAQISESYARIVKEELFLLTPILLSTNSVETRITKLKGQGSSS